jgi:hypothetical protein
MCAGSKADPGEGDQGGRAKGSQNNQQRPMWLTFWTVTIAMALIFSVMAQVIQNDSLARGR